MNKFTPGPWSIPHFALSDEYWAKSNAKFRELGFPVEKSKRRCDCKFVLCEHYMGAICTIHVDNGIKSIVEGGNDGPPIEEAIANAHLIAAAPMLLSALEDMLAGWKYIRSVHGDLYGVGWDRAQAAAESAIAAAKGGRG